ncbi:hypothetical protein HOP52_06590 [Halomonas campisalis]|uniref:Uncharacterized protein n=1 Tax=Billgrantia campisalis TaxID=74661 RepID=A0ABS9P764_9GAMM|nr:hypothetical protein [Halomonas campisalis]MCG6657431.1 hypothetical protein [Halomonas campisalis]MDR5863224.1 hypothetical protein [Halomonas campisalis]
MKARRRLTWIALVALLALAGCGGNDGDSPDTEVTNGEQEAEAVEESAEPAPEPEVAPFDVPVMITASASLQSDRRLVVQGETNLPEGARLLIVVERELSGVRWQSRTNVEEGRFMVGPLGPGSGLPDGGYTITVNLPEASVQPVSVRERIGDQGEHLSGPLVQESRHGLGQVASYTRRYLIGSEPRRTTDRVEVLEVE